MSILEGYSRIRGIVAEFAKCNSVFEQAINAYVGALAILSQLDEVQADVNHQEDPDLNALRQEISVVVAKCLIVFQKNNLASDFFDINGLPPEYPIAKVSSLFESLAVGLEALSVRNFDSKEEGTMQLEAAKASLDVFPDLQEEESAILVQSFLYHQKILFTSKFLSAAGNEGLYLPQVFSLMSKRIDELLKYYRPYDEQAYMALKSIARNMGEEINLPPYKEKEKYKHVFVGLVARSRAGKSVIGDFLKNEFNFKSYSLSTVIKLMLFAKGSEPPFTREQLIAAGNEFREMLGFGVFVKGVESIFTLAGNDQLLLFDGLRDPNEWQAIQNLAQTLGGEAVLISVDTDDYSNVPSDLAIARDQRIRFNRAIEAGTDKDPKGEDGFSDWAETDAGEMVKINKTMLMATHKVINRDGSKEATLDQVREIMKQLIL